MARNEAPAAEAAETAEVMDSLGDPEFTLAAEVTYHGARQGFLEAAHRWAMFLTIMLGAAAMTKFGSENALGLGAAAVAAADIAFDFTGRAQRHADLRRRYYELVADVARDGAEKADFAKRWMLISADEPPIRPWVEEVARWNTCQLMDRDGGPRPAWWKRLLAHVWPN